MEENQPLGFIILVLILFSGAFLWALFCAGGHSEGFLVGYEGQKKRREKRMEKEKKKQQTENNLQEINYKEEAEKIAKVFEGLAILLEMKKKVSEKEEENKIKDKVLN